MHAFILAGGFATRLWPLTEQRAKPLLPLAGKPIITHLVERIPAHIPITVSTNAAFKEDMTLWRDTLPDRNITVRVEETKNDDEKLGALGATAQWIREEKIDDDVLLLTGDNYVGFDMQTFLERFAGYTLIAAHDIGNPEDASAFGTVLLNDDGTTARAFEEKPAQPKTGLVSTGCSVLPKDALPVLLDYARHHPDNVGGIFEELLQRKQHIDCFIFHEPWFDIGSFGAYLAATKTLVGQTPVIGERVDMNNVEMDGSVVIGNNCTLNNCTLINTVLFDGCTIEDCVLEDCIIDEQCTLEHIDITGKMLRKETTLQTTADYTHTAGGQTA